MQDPYDINIGIQIRYLRKQKSMTLKELSERSGLSVNAISRIENCQTSPTVSSVHRLALALDVPIAALFDGSVASPTVFIQSESRKKVRMEGRILEMLGAGMVDPLTEPFYVTLDGREKTKGSPYKHSGEEFAYCLDGEVNFTVGNNTFTLHANDSLLFKSDQPHSWENPADQAARFLLIFIKGEPGSPSLQSEPQIMREFSPSIEMKLD
ncbi:MAG: cupin domain-containing protein [Chloroflexi bacterium]|nr:cupin domain-containing protein [Chloroflexota bacterium]